MRVKTDACQMQQKSLCHRWTSCGRTERLILTLHEKGAQQLVGGHGFDLCSQVDVSPNHQRCSPEPQDPAERPNQQDFTPEHKWIREDKYQTLMLVTHLSR